MFPNIPKEGERQKHFCDAPTGMGVCHMWIMILMQFCDFKKKRF